MYDDWELSGHQLPRRSYLYSLPPIGIGAPMVESLTSYIQRLAAAHAVETGTLVNRELLLRVPYAKGERSGQVPMKLPQYSFYIEAHTLNGTGPRAQLWTSALEELTQVRHLDLLTALPWADGIDRVHLLRTNRAWCASCYENWHSSGHPVYEPLLWMFQVVTVCPHHRQPLDSTCPTCGRTQYVFSSKSRPGHCSRCQSWLGRVHDTGAIDRDVAEQLRTAEMVADLLAAGPCIRNRVRWKGIPRIDSLLAFCRNQNVSLTRALTGQIESNQEQDETHSWHVHPRVPDSVVEQALQAALQAPTPASLQVLANQLGYRSDASLRDRFPELCRQIATRRRATLKVSRSRSHVTPVPRHRVEKALVEALNKDGLTHLRTASASVGLSSTRRFYKDFRDLRSAIVAKNRLAISAQNTAVNAIESALRAAFDEEPVPAVTEIAHRLGFACVSAVTRRFPELTAELRERHLRRRQAKCGHRANEAVRHRLIQALTESPPPSCAEIVRRVAGHKTVIREDFPDLWRELRLRYRHYKQELRLSQRQAFAADVRRAVMELHREGVYPTRRLVLAKFPAPQFRSWHIVAGAIRLALHELCIEPLPASHRQV